MLCIFGTILLYILMELQTHQCPLGPVFSITSVNLEMRRLYVKMLVSKLKHTRKNELILLDQNTAVYFGTRLLEMLMKQQTHQYPLGPVFKLHLKIWK